MAHKSLRIKIQDKSEKVVLFITPKDVYGNRLGRTQQITIPRHEFEKALSEATVEIPWTGLI